ncbi:hypothetical protein EVAR_686_1 [Eumeta japonica]|uniref:Uncharacterized protein n=1 Tax=Eumeta variegata TaxID=151549 RepID=A0A4C1SEI0_EUMVA|nr:hypothetical protein EVAR_686_1 [Eumeta japonica]
MLYMYKVIVEKIPPGLKYKPAQDAKNSFQSKLTMRLVTFRRKDPRRKIPTISKIGVSLPCWGSMVHVQQYSPLTALHPGRVMERSRTNALHCCGICKHDLFFGGLQR